MAGIDVPCGFCQNETVLRELTFRAVLSKQNDMAGFETFRAALSKNETVWRELTFRAVFQKNETESSASSSILKAAVSI